MSLAEVVAQVEEVVEEPRWSLGDRLTKARKAAGLTGEEMAARLSSKLDRAISKQAVSNWENDVNQPRQFLAIVHAWADECPAAFTAAWLLQRADCYMLLPEYYGQRELALEWGVRPPLALAR